jgi:hypothetical protein
MTAKHHVKSHKRKSKQSHNKTNKKHPKKCNKCKKHSGGEPPVQPEKTAGMFSFMSTSSSMFPSWPFSSTNEKKYEVPPDSTHNNTEQKGSIPLKNEDGTDVNSSVVSDSKPTEQETKPVEQDKKGSFFGLFGGDIIPMNNHLPSTKPKGGKKRKSSKKTNAVKQNK